MDFIAQNRSKPSLVDTNIITQLHILKTQAGGDEPPMTRIVNKVKSDVASFFTSNFWVILFILILMYLLWRRYRWYNNLVQEREAEHQARLVKRKQVMESKRKQKMMYQIMMEKKQAIEETQQKPKDTHETKPTAQSCSKKPSSTLLSSDFGTYDGKVYASY